MTWLLAILPVVLACGVIVALLLRRGELREYAQSHQALHDARTRGSQKARLQHPDIDLTRCIGCRACVDACPEEGVLSFMHGQVIMVHGARCVGHGLCAAACPTGAIALTIGDLSDRRDLPALDEDLEAVGVPGLYLAGELSGFALVRTAVTQGVAVADAVHQQRSTRAGAGAAVPDLLIVGAGPAGLACALRARELGLSFDAIEQEEHTGGTVAAYPRRKMVMTQPLDLPLHGRLTQLTYQREELIELWEGLIDTHALPVHTGEKLEEIRREPDQTFVVRTSRGERRAHAVCLALGRRGSPRRLGVPGEELPKVSYALYDVDAYSDAQVLVVGGGDSAIEAAIGLAMQPGNQVTLSYRREAFFRLKARNETRLERAVAQGALRVAYRSSVTRIEPGTVHLRTDAEDGATDEDLPNDHVFVLAGGEPPFELLAAAGVSFDPADRPESADATGGGSGLLVALLTTLLTSAGLLGWVLWYRAYYGLEVLERAGSALHGWLRPTGPVGLTCGVAACALCAWNLAYLLRRSPRLGRWMPGSLRWWMSTHVLTGVFALLCVVLHGGFGVRNSVGGHALLAMAIVVTSGAIGRYLYAFVPRAANGAELAMAELRAQLGALSADWDRTGQRVSGRVNEVLQDLVTDGRWKASLVLRLWSLVAGQFRLRRHVRSLRVWAERDGIPTDEIRLILTSVKKAYRLTLLVTHYEEVRAVLSSWRYIHRWLALLMVLLAIVHIVTALRFGAIDWSVLPFVGGSAGQ